MTLRHRLEWSPSAYGIRNDPYIVDLLTEISAFQYNIPADPVYIASPAMHAASLPPPLMDIYPAGSHSSRILHDDGPLVNVEVMQTHPYHPHIDLPDARPITSLLQSTFSLVHPPSYAERGARTVDFGTTGKHEHGREVHQTERPPVVHRLAPQETYKVARRPRGLIGKPQVIEFVVNGKRGIRLSDASEANWARFEGGEDKPLSNESRLQIIIRLNFFGCAPWHSKVSTADFTAKRRPITRKKLAAAIAKCVKKFIKRERMNGHTCDHPQCSWGNVSLENVFLTRMTRVSVASWQPEIYVERQLIPPQGADSSLSSSSSGSVV